MSSLTWQPEQNGVQELVQLLSEFQKPSADQSRALARLEECRTIPEFNNYLAYIFAAEIGSPIEVRQTAGLLLKNNLRLMKDGQVDPFIRQAILSAVQNPNRVIRHTGGTCVVNFVCAQGFSSWPELSSSLADMLGNEESSRNNTSADSIVKIDGALDTLFKLWEERPECLEGEFPPGTNQRPSDILIPKSLVHMHHSEPQIRALAIKVLNLASNFMPRALLANLDMYTSSLFQLASDSDSEVRKAVCSSLVQLLSIAPDHLQQHLQPIIEYMLTTTQDSDEDIAVIACEFWSALPESGLDIAILRPYLPRLLPILLRHMVWEEYDDEVTDAENAEAEALRGVVAVEKDSEIKPHRYVHAAHGVADSEEEEEEEEDIGRWNLRRCSAAGLDILSSTFGDEILPLLLPTIETRLQDSDWRARESAILALGAVSQGCISGLHAHLPVITSALIRALSDPRPLVRSIACWALTRYARSLLDRAKDGDRSLLDQVIHGVSIRISDHNRVVQGAACGSIANFCEEACEEDIIQYSEIILNALGKALSEGKYGRKALRHAYDAVATMAEHCPSAFKTKERTPAIFAPLFSKLSSLPDGDKDILPLLECIGIISAASDAAQLHPFAENAFMHLVDIADRMRAGAASGAYEKEEADEFIIGALDALSGMIEGLGAGSESLIRRSAIREIIVLCISSDSNPDVRQSAFAVIGDIACFSFPHIYISLRDIVNASLAHLEPASVTHANMGACNNAAWSLGEITLRCSPEDVKEYSLPALERIVPILMAPTGGIPRSLLENVAVLLGRIAKVSPEPIALHALVFLGQWCGVLRNIRDGPEKRDAFIGLCIIIRSMNFENLLRGMSKEDSYRNVSKISSFWRPLCEAAASWKEIHDEELKGNISAVLQLLKNILIASGQWDSAISTFSEPLQSKLGKMYKL